MIFFLVTLIIISIISVINEYFQNFSTLSCLFLIPIIVCTSLRSQSQPDSHFRAFKPFPSSHSPSVPTVSLLLVHIRLVSFLSVPVIIIVFNKYHCILPVAVCVSVQQTPDRRTQPQKCRRSTQRRLGQPHQNLRRPSLSSLDFNEMLGVLPQLRNVFSQQDLYRLQAEAERVNQEAWDQF